MAEWNQYDTLKAWADIVIERWEERIAQLGIVDTGELLRSFHSQIVMDANGNAAKIVFTLAYYGFYVDAGVGKEYGSDGNALGQLSFTPKREKRPWYNKIMYSQTMRLGEIIAERTGQKAVLAIVRSLSDDSKLKQSNL